MRVFAASDMFLSKAPWATYQSNDFVPENPWVGDTVDFEIPQSALFASRLRDGDLATWDPYISGGVPLGSIPNTAMLSPLSLPWLAMPAWLAPAYTKLLEMIVAIGGAFLFLRRLRLSPPAAWIGGLSFVGSAFFVSWTNWPQTRVAALIPALFWAAERLVQERRIRDGLLLAMVVASMLLGGFPSVTGYALYAAGPYFLLRVLTEYRGQLRRIVRLISGAGAAVAAGALLVAGQLLPFVAMLQQYSIGNRQQLPFRHIDSRMLITTLAPWATGTMDLQKPPVWFGISHPVESFSFLGAVVVVLALLGTTITRRVDVPWGTRMFFVVAASITVTAVYLGGPLLGMLQHLPVFSNNYVGRARSVLGFFVGVLAAMGYDSLIRHRAAHPMAGSRRRLALAAGAGVWLVALVGTALIWRRARSLALSSNATRSPIEQDHGVFFGQQVRIAGAIIVVSVICVLVARFASRWFRGRTLAVTRGLAIALLPVLFLAQVLPVVLSFWARIPRDEFYPRTPTQAFLAQNLGHDRYVATSNAMPPGTASLYELRTLGGHAFPEGNFADLIKAVYPHAFLTPTYAVMSTDPTALDSSVLDRLGVRYLVTAPGDRIPGAQRFVGADAGTAQLRPGVSVSISLPDGGPLRGVGVLLSAPYTTAAARPDIQVRVLDAAGRELASGSRRIGRVVNAGPLLIPVMGEDLPSGPLTVRIVLHADGPMTVSGQQDVPRLDVVGDANDGLRMVATGPATVYKRESALPRIRWAPTALVEPDQGRTISMLRNRRAEGSGEQVLLDRPGPEADGKSASVRVGVDSGDQIRATVDAQGDGYLVVADALQQDWVATLDGKPVPLRAADHGLVAVAVPPGVHQVRLSYSVPYNGIGTWVSLGTGVLFVVLFGAELWWRRRRRTTAELCDALGNQELIAVDDRNG